MRRITVEAQLDRISTTLLRIMFGLKISFLDYSPRLASVTIVLASGRISCMFHNDSALERKGRR